MGCEFSGPGKKYGCTQSDGVLSNIDIRKIIKETGAEPFLLEGAMVKELIFDNDQWVAYDDAETIRMKENFARSR
jgi:chitinase